MKNSGLTKVSWSDGRIRISLPNKARKILVGAIVGSLSAVYAGCDLSRNDVASSYFKDRPVPVYEILPDIR